jgi:hypothetical protein
MPVDEAAVERFTVRAYRDGDERAILDLFARCFPHAPRSLGHFDWKYRRDPFGDRHISLTFDEREALVGHYSGYVVPFFGQDRDVPAHQIGDTMTDPGVRHIGRGATSILGRTALHFYEHFCEGKIGFNYGFNVANIQRFSLRFLRSDRVEPVAFRVRDLHAKPLARIGAIERRLRGYGLEIVRATTPEWDELFDRVKHQYRFLVRRDGRYVSWRYLECPDTDYVVIAVRKWRRLTGWIVFRIDDKRFLWGDALFDPAAPGAVEVMLRHVVPAYPVDRIEGWFPARPQWWDAILSRLHFEKRAEPQDLSVMCVPFTWADAVERIREDLYYTWGDSDLF